jgi:methyl-accepting chemotaxis protein
MVFNNMKITTKIAVSSAVFLAPMGIMLYFVISLSNASAQPARKELQGIAALKPAGELLRLLPRRQEMILGGDIFALGDETERLLDRLDGEFEGPSPAAGIRSSLTAPPPGSLEGVLEMFRGIAKETEKLMAHIGDSYGLAAGEGGTATLTGLALKDLPQAWERCLELESIIRLSEFRQVFSPEDQKNLEACRTLLKEIDYPRSNAAFETLGRQEDLSSGGPETEALLSGLSNYRTSLGRLVGALENAVQADRPGEFFPVLRNRLSETNEDIFLLWESTVDRLGRLCQERVQASRDRLIRSLAAAVLTSILAFTAVVMTNVSISRSMARLRQFFSSLQRDDLSPVIEVNSRDEFGELMLAFNGFLKKLERVFDSFSQHASMVSSSVYDLSASAKEISTTATEQSTSVAEIVATMEDNKNLSRQAAQKTEEVAELMEQTQKLSQRGAELRDVNQDMMQDIRDQNAKTIEEIMSLADMLNRIDETIGIIDSIADQTKLIAFNASLEASSSGEEGARFADSVAESTAEIKEKIEEVQSASRALIEEANDGSRQIAYGYDRMSEQKAVFENIVEVSRNVAVRSRQISNLSKQQELASSQIFQALTEISAGVKQFVTATASTSKIADNLNTMSIELKETVNKYRTGGQKNDG